MKTTIFATLALAATLTSSNAVGIGLFEYLFNIDGDTAPSGVNFAGFNTSTGLGTILMTIDGAGDHFGGVYVDHEIDEAANTYYNEFGTATGSLAAGQSWEIDEPGFSFGDIYTNFTGGALDNSNAVPSGLEDDVSMALMWNFSLTSAKTALLRFHVSTTAPNSGFYLTQTDPDSQASIYFSSSLTTRGQGMPDGGSTLALLLCACGGLAGWRAVFKFLS